MPRRRAAARASSVAAPHLAAALGVGELWLKLDTANPTHSFQDRVVAIAAAKAQELGLTTLACSSTGNLAGAVAARAAAEGLEAVVFCPADLEPEKLAAAAVYGPTIYAVDGNYDHCARLCVELSFELPWGFVNVNLRTYYAEGSKTLAYEIAEQLGWEFPDAVFGPIASGSLFHKVGRGFEDLRGLGLVEGAVPRLHGGAAARGRGRVRGGTRDAGARTRSRARSRSATGRRRRRRGDRTETGRDLAFPRRVGENMALAETTLPARAAGTPLGALREAVRRGDRAGASSCRHRRPEDRCGHTFGRSRSRPTRMPSHTWRPVERKTLFEKI